MNFFTILVSGSLRTIVPRCLRMNSLDRLIMPWRLPAWALLILPFAVILKRFFALDFVFILGIFISSRGRSGTKPANRLFFLE